MDLTNELRIGVGLTVFFVISVVFLMIKGAIPSGPVPVNAVPSSFQTTRNVTPFLNRGDDSEIENFPSQTPSVTTTQPATTPTTGQPSYTTSDVAKHNSQNDCWIIIGTGVYDVTNYLYAHPGGAGQIIPYCGADATVAFQSVRRHASSRTQNDLTSVFIGTLK